MKKEILGLALPLLMIYACEPPADIAPPTITLTNHANSTTYTTGNEIHFEADFKDDEKLGQYEIIIQADFEKSTVSNFYGPFSYESLVQLEEAEKNVHLHIDIPSNAAAGKYTMSITAKDAEGNESDTITRQLTFINNADKENPAIVIATPATGTQVLRGTSFVLGGTLSDNGGLMDARISLINQQDNSISLFTRELSFDPETEQSADIYETIAIPSNAVAGMYILQIITRDEVYNISVTELTIEVQ